jgi:fructose-1-phosphate kinase PfkB-like protein
MLADDGVQATIVPLRRVTRTCVAVVERAESATSTDLYEPATAFDGDEWSAYAAAVESTVSEHDGPQAPWVALSGSVPPGVPLEELGALRDGAGSRAHQGEQAGGVRTAGRTARLRP